MRKSRVFSTIALLAIIAAPAALRSVVAADAAAMPPAPKVSTFAPAKDLASQADRYIKSLVGSVANEGEYKDNETKIATDSNTLVVVALALGLHDQESKYKDRAESLMKAAQAVAATKDYAAAKKAVAALQEAAESGPKGDAALKWEKVASLAELMKQVPKVNNSLKRYIKPDKFKVKAKEAAGCTAVIAAIAQGSMANLAETQKPGEAEKWYSLAAAMRDDAAAVNKAIHQGDEPAAAKAMKKLQQGCDDCHDVFHPATAEKNKK